MKLMLLAVFAVLVAGVQPLSDRALEGLLEGDKSEVNDDTVDVGEEEDILLEKLLLKLKARQEKKHKTMSVGAAMERLFYRDFQHAVETKAIFDMFDIDQSGTITVSDFSGYLRNNGKTEVKLADFHFSVKSGTLEEYKPYFVEQDTNKDGFWTYEEFAAHYETKYYLTLSQDDWKNYYLNIGDTNGDGKIELSEGFTIHNQND